MTKSEYCKQQQQLTGGVGCDPLQPLDYPLPDGRLLQVHSMDRIILSRKKLPFIVDFAWSEDTLNIQGVSKKTRFREPQP